MFKAETVTSRERYSREAGKRLASELLASLGAPPKAAWLFAAPGEGLQELLAGIHEALGTTCLVGCTTDGEISASGFGSGSVVLAGIDTDRIDFHPASVKDLSTDCIQAGTRLAGQLPRATRYVQLFTDGLTGNGCAVLRGMTSVLGREVPICGGAAADADRFRQTWQFAGPELLSDGAVAIGFSGDFRVGIGVRSGWSPIGIARKVTRAAGHILYELDGQPALDVYERFFGKHVEKMPTVGVEYPLGLVDHSGILGSSEYNMLLRASIAVDRKQRSIQFAGEIPEGAWVRLTCGDYHGILDATREATRAAVEGLDGCEPLMVFFFSCMARKIVLGRRVEDEIAIVRQEVGSGVPVLGFYSYGEFCPVKRGGPSLLHNETATVSILGLQP